MSQFSENITGASNYHLTVYEDDTENSQPKLKLWFFDTND